jgi:hypothetical protein
MDFTSLGMSWQRWIWLCWELDGSDEYNLTGSKPVVMDWTLLVAESLDSLYTGKKILT